MSRPCFFCDGTGRVEAETGASCHEGDEDAIECDSCRGSGAADPVGMTLTPLQTKSLRALAELQDEDRRHRPTYGIRSVDVAYRMKNPPQHRRMGNGAVKGSWSGYTSPSLHVGGSLTSLANKGLVDKRHERDRSGYTDATYRINQMGRAVLDEINDPEIQQERRHV